MHQKLRKKELKGQEFIKALWLLYVQLFQKNSILNDFHIDMILLHTIYQMMYIKKLKMKI